MRSRLSSSAALFALIVAACSLTAPVRADDVTIKFSPEWKFNPHSEYPGADGSVTVAPDGSSLKLSFDFSKGGSCVSSGVKLSDVAQLSGIEVKVTGPGHFGLTLVDATGQTFVYFIGIPGDSSPAFEIDPTHPNNSYGGAKDKTIHYPIKAIGVMVSKNPDALTGTEEVDEILLKGATAPAPAPASP
jgi:hypothetical protein